MERSILTISTVVLFSILRRSDSGGMITACPTGCQCGFESDSHSALMVNCRDSIPDVEELSQQLDSLLSAAHIVERLTSLNITDTPLTHVPASVCQLLNLTSLNLDRNSLVELPDKCVNRLTKLAVLTATNNCIAGLQDGLFDGLQRLQALALSRNKIASIGLRVFSNSSDLTELRSIDLSHNRLTSLEPWWYYRCINGNETSPVRVLLTDNWISRFTNELQFDFRCGMKGPYGYLDLSDNRITHISDPFRGWNIASLTQIWCLANYKGPHSMIKVNLKQAIDCDCTDFMFYKLNAISQHVFLLYNVFCSAANRLYRMRAQSVPLIELVCEVTDQCPSGCRCVYRPENVTLHVYCSAANLLSLPLRLPPLPKSYVRYKLDFSNCKRLRRLEYRSYFVNTTILDASDSAIKDVDVDAWQQLVQMDSVFLQRNRLQYLPDVVLSNTALKSRLDISNNSWLCFCEHAQFNRWLKSVANKVSHPESILCETPTRLRGESIMHMSDGEFCVNPLQRQTLISAILASLSALLILTLSVLIAVYLLRFRLHKKWRFHPFDRDECLGEDMDYDVFLCCSSEDHDPHGVHILEMLESKGYHVCYHVRDFLPGELITDNMCRGVERSKRTVCLLTQAFLNSSYCMTEFDMAFHHNVAVKRKKRLIVLMMLDNPNDLYANDASDTTSLRQHLSQHTYIDYTADDWLDKLLYALPLRGLLQRDRDDTANVAVDDVPLLENDNNMQQPIG